jgi:uncharacterized lipoprotein YajG
MKLEFPIRRATAAFCLALALLAALTLSPISLAFLILVPLFFFVEAVSQFSISITERDHRPQQRLALPVVSPRPLPVRCPR